MENNYKKYIVAVYYSYASMSSHFSRIIFLKGVPTYAKDTHTHTYTHI